MTSNKGRKAPPLNLSDDERETLERLLNCGDTGIELRARIVLASSENKQNKVIAEELGTNEALVGKWKKVYRTGGIDSLQVPHKGGRPRKDPTTEDLHERIQDYLRKRAVDNPEDMGEGKSGKKKPTVAEIASALHVSENAVSYELNKAGITLERARQWSFESKDNLPQWEQPVLCIHRSNGCGAIVVASRALPCENGRLQAQGVFTTTNRALAKELEKSASRLSLNGILETAGQFANVSTFAKGPEMNVCISDAINACPEGKATDFHVFSFGTKATYVGPRLSRCHFHFCSSEEEMVDAFRTWFLEQWKGWLITAKRLGEADKLSQHLLQYGSHVKDGTAPFNWRLKWLPDDSGHGETQNPTCMKTMGVLSEVKSWADLERLILSNDELRESDEPCTRVGAVVFQTNKDGETTFQIIRSKEVFLAMGKFDFSSKEGFEHSMTELENCSLLFEEDLIDANNELFIESSKKDKD